MCTEDNLRTELGKLLLLVVNLPRATVRKQILQDIIAWCEAQLKL